MAACWFTTWRRRRFGEVGTWRSKSDVLAAKSWLEPALSSSELLGVSSMSSISVLVGVIMYCACCLLRFFCEVFMLFMYVCV